jgi:hypothetical protein
MLTKENVVLVLFFVVALAYLFYVVYTTYFKKQEEHFTELSDYQARMTVMKVFDTVLHRKPAPDEIDKYAKITNEQDMLVAVLADYNVTNASTSSNSATVVHTSVPDEQAINMLAPTPASETFEATITPAHVPLLTSVPVVPVSAKKHTIEDNLSTIMDSVNSIRALLHAQTMSEGS